MTRTLSVERLKARLEQGGATQLGIGPMSRECVDVTIELANVFRVPLMLIASRRQVECAAQGGGYVNGWTTESFAQYVRQWDPDGYIVLCRDHAGPWQSRGEVEQALPDRAAMASAKQSLEVDIDSGLHVLHLDPSIDIHQDVSQPVTIARLLELYSFCVETAAVRQASVAFEVGSEEQTGTEQEVDIFRNLLARTEEYCECSGAPKPLFVVVQTGTLVKETRNVGSFDEPFRKNGNVPPEIQVPKLVSECREHHVFLKEHNADYQSDEALRWHPRLGIHATNIAPEFGVGQTKAILEVCEGVGLSAEADSFLELAYDSGKWRRWMLPESAATDRDRGIIAGHYIFGTPEGAAILDRMRRACRGRNVDFDRSIRDALRSMILRIMTCFRLCS